MTLFDAAPEPRVKVRMTIAYDGGGFHGFAVQPEVRTVGGTLSEALERVLRHPVELAVAGRTDAGVHARGQVVSFEAHPEVEPDRLARSVNGQLGPEIVVRDCDLVHADFDARHSARRRSYRYTIVNRPEPDPFLARFAWWVPQPLDLAALRLAADPFVGEHDFASFCRKASNPNATTIRRILTSHWVDEGDGILRYEIGANAFCWQMVRSVVGTLVEAGSGKLRPGDILGILRARDRAAAGQVAPPHGLCLEAVEY